MHGVPQGSVLGPILYVMYINDMPDVINDTNCQNIVHKDDTKLFKDNCDNCGTVPTYADDSTFTITTKTRHQAQDKITDNIRKLKTYLDSNSLSINLGKTEIIEVMVRQKRARIGGTPPQLAVQTPEGNLKVILAKKSCRLLGGNLNMDGNWNHQMEKGLKPLLPNLRSAIGSLSHISQHLPRACRLLLANGLILSRILYLIQMWGGLTKKHSKTIQTLMNKTARIVTGLPRATRSRKLMEECGWLYFGELVTYHSLLTLWSLLYHKTPYHLSTKVSLDQDLFAVTSVARISTSRNSFRWRSVDSWNNLSRDLRSESTYLKFKKCLKRSIIDARPEIVQRVQPCNWD